MHVASSWVDFITACLGLLLGGEMASRGQPANTAPQNLDGEGGWPSPMELSLFGSAGEGRRWGLTQHRPAGRFGGRMADIWRQISRPINVHGTCPKKDSLVASERRVVSQLCQPQVSHISLHTGFDVMLLGPFLLKWSNTPPRGMATHNVTALVCLCDRSTADSSSSPFPPPPPFPDMGDCASWWPCHES